MFLLASHRRARPDGSYRQNRSWWLEARQREGARCGFGENAGGRRFVDRHEERGAGRNTPYAIASALVLSGFRRNGYKQCPLESDVIKQDYS